MERTPCVTSSCLFRGRCVYLPAGSTSACCVSTTVDFEMAKFWLEKAAKQKNAHAIFLLGQQWFDTCQEEAETWFQEAYTLDNNLAFDIGVFYDKHKKETLTLTWFQRATQQAYTGVSAKKFLVTWFRERKNIPQALYWANTIDAYQSQSVHYLYVKENEYMWKMRPYIQEGNKKFHELNKKLKLNLIGGTHYGTERPAMIYISELFIDNYFS